MKIVVRKLAAGAIGGLVGTFVMDQFQKGLSRVSNDAPISWGTAAQERNTGEPATEAAARKLSEAVTDEPVRGNEKKLAGLALHYAFGAGMGVVHAASRMQGPVFGTIVWLAGDEVMNRVSGFAKKQNKMPPASHVSGLMSHLVFGLALNVAQRLAARRAP